jgi:cystathionine beta-lyase family protein involved in aluminum resistance
MKARELIEALKKVDPDRDVYVFVDNDYLEVVDAKDRVDGEGDFVELELE